jgi:predicted nucleic acid-binding protein
MIVVDANVIAYLLIPGQYTAASEKLLLQDQDWAAPRLWRSEVRNVLANYVRAGQLEWTDAALLFDRASLILGGNEFEVETSDVLRLSKASGCSAYDCEYVALAEFLDLPFVTADAKLRRAFPKRAKALGVSI